MQYQGIYGGIQYIIYGTISNYLDLTSYFF